MEILESYRSAAKAFDLDALYTIACDLLAAHELVLPHPTRPNVTTHARASARARLGNVVYFADASGGNRWVLVQAMNFIDGYVTEDGPVVLFDEKCADIVDHVAQNMRSGKDDVYWTRNDRFGGISVGQTRPYHYFYDQAIHLAPLRARLLAEQSIRSIATALGTYLDPAKICAWDSHTPDPGCYYLTPNVIGGTWWRARDSASFFEAAARMENMIRANIPEVDILYPDGSLVVWFGVTAQKRSWLEQIQGYAEIANSLARHHPSVVVLLDGLTATDGRHDNYRDDLMVAEAITRRLDARILPVTLVGRDYATKIAYCKKAAAFIANAGSGSIVPLRFCAKPGVLHSNAAIQSFRDDSYDYPVHFVEPEFVREVPHPENPRGDWISYQIPWQYVHNRFADILRELGLASPEHRQVPDLAKLPISAFELFGQLSGQVKPNHSSAHILRLVGGMFAKTGDPTTAAALYEKALLLDPTDAGVQQFIRQRRLLEK